ncbi:ferredoxin [Pseudonocardia spinosispora]|uniref:ferredoxin n=1 Tax=Pseudonocardia spinosispora TaxID=103441 RepID=UPI00041A339A|nr:ferredoxin [Pseudonocardia spinosispora]
MSFTVRIDSELCMGAQRCMFLAPEVFDLNDEGIAEVLDTSGLTQERAEKLAYECPNMAIEITRS